MPLTHSKSRLEGFSDSVFAFAATLLVVSLEIPEDFKVMREQLSDFWVFGLSFLALMLMWKLHYNFFRRVERIDNMIIALNMLFLFVILFFVYPMKFMINVNFTSAGFQSMDDVVLLFQLYSGGFAFVFLCLVLLYWWAARKSFAAPNRRELLFYARYFCIFMGVGLFSVLLASFQVGIRIGVPGHVYVLLGPLCYWFGSRYHPENFEDTLVLSNDGLSDNH